MSTGYALAYRLGITPWERAGEGAQASFDTLLDREERERHGALGRALDLGCGRGAHTHELAARGWEAVGVDNISRAVDSARGRAGAGVGVGAGDSVVGGGGGTGSATFVDGDVTRLGVAALGTFDFFLDIGCFHGLTPEEQRAEAAGVTRLANPGATVLMLAFRPNRMPLVPAGVAADAVASAFSAWDLLSTEPADMSGMPKPMHRTAPQWYRFRLKG